MNKKKQKRLEKKGWKVGTAEEYLGLSSAESRCIELRLASREAALGTLWAQSKETFGLYPPEKYVTLE